MKSNQINSEASYDVIIIGGGLAGLSCAIHLAKYDFKILVLEQNVYPKHKVCGEYISKEVIPYLSFLGYDPFNENAKDITSFELSSPKNSKISCSLPLGGFGISRHTIDHSLAKLAKSNKVKVLIDQVEKIEFSNEQFDITTRSNNKFTAKLAIGAYGKRSSIDVNLDRSYIKQKSPYLAVKIHARGDFPDDLVALHNFEGGYCGVSKVENNNINLCYIVTYKVFKKYKNIEDFQQNVIFKNKYLRKVFSESIPVFEKPLTISQISFSTKSPVEQHIIMCGDTAGMIHPLCGNGMSMAIRSAQIASNLSLKFLNNEISRSALEKLYVAEWEKAFKYRLKFGHFAAFLFRHTGIIEFCIPLLRLFPGLLPWIIKNSHGELMHVS